MVNVGEIEVRQTREATPFELAQDLLCLGGERFDLSEYPYLKAVYNTRASRVGLFTGRQVAKSTTLASKLVLNAVCHPGSVQVFVAPLQEQAMVFAQQRLRDFIAGSPIIRDCFFDGPAKIDQVLRRVFNAGNSMITLGYAQRTADRLRGQSVKDGKMQTVRDPRTGEVIEVGGAQLTFDECLATGTLVDTPDGPVPVDGLQVGDSVFAFTADGTLTVDTVQDIAYKGARQTYLVEFDDGSSLRCTENEKFYTSEGWRFLSDLVDVTGKTDPAWHGARGFKHHVPRQAVFQVPPVVLQSWGSPVSVCEVESLQPPISCCPGSGDREPGVWGTAMAGSLGLPPLVGGLTPVDPLKQREEDRDDGVARRANAALSRVLDHGRRSLSGQAVVPTHRRLHTGGELPDTDLVCGAWLRPSGDRDAWVLFRALPNGRYSRDRETSPAPHAPVDALQAAGSGCARHTEGRPSTCCVPGSSTASVRPGSDRPGMGRARPRPHLYARASSVLGTPKGLTPRSIVAVAAYDVEDVWDITTKKHHTFFANGIAVHNCQDIMPEVYPVVEEMAFRAKSPRFWYCGTPKSMNNPMEGMRARSTGAEWGVRCQATGCKKWNLSWTEKNIGNTGIICEFCGAALNTNADGRWIVARKMDLHRGRGAAITMESYRVPQLIVKPVMDRKVKWLELLEKLRTYSTEKFRNEVLGLPNDSGSVPVTLDQLRACCDDTRSNVVPNPSKGRFPPLVMGVDWAFNGEDSYTFVSIGGYNPFPGRYDVYYWKIFKGVETDPLYQIDWIVKAASYAGVQLLGCDWGCGQVQNLQLINRLGEDRIIQMWHTGMQGTGSARAARAKWEPKTRKWHLARTRVLTDVFEMVRTRQITFPKESDCQELFDHFMAVSMEYNEKTNTQRYVNVKPDDGLHSVTYGTIAGEFLVRGDFKGHSGSTVTAEGAVSDLWNETPNAETDSLYH